jgi:anti-sigma-K factor RskA
MTTFASAGPPAGDIDMLLPWYAAGTLGRRAAARVGAALTHDAELARHYEFVREELAETIHVNESLGAPTGRAGDRLAAALAVETTATATNKESSLARWRRLGNWLTELSPRALKWSATMAALALVLQAGLIAELSGIRYGIQSLESGSAKDASALVTFVPQASSADITKFLRAHRAQVVKGPTADGIYTIRISADALSAAEVAEVVQDFRQPNDLVRFIGLTR